MSDEPAGNPVERADATVETAAERNPRFFHEDTAVGRRRRWLFRELLLMSYAGELPTTTSSLYYAGVAAGEWLADGADHKRKVDEATAAGRRPPSKPRTPRQDVSKAVQSLITCGYVHPSALLDLHRQAHDYTAPDRSRRCRR
jgi:hypothetical protein